MIKYFFNYMWECIKQLLMPLVFKDFNRWYMSEMPSRAIIILFDFSSFHLYIVCILEKTLLLEERWCTELYELRNQNLKGAWSDHMLIRWNRIIIILVHKDVMFNAWPKLAEKSNLPILSQHLPLHILRLDALHTSSNYNFLLEKKLVILSSSDNLISEGNGDNKVIEACVRNQSIFSFAGGIFSIFYALFWEVWESGCFVCQQV